MSNSLNYGASPENWANFDLVLELTKDLLPVVSNPNVKISDNSRLKQLGKVPSRYNKERMVSGIPNWTQHEATPKEIEKWSKEPDYGICIQTRYVRALDIDVTDTEQCTAIYKLIAQYIPFKAFRKRSNSPKFLIAFILQGEFPKRVVKTNGGVIECLMNGQQFVAVGTHPSGVRYEGLEAIDSFPELSVKQFEELWKALVDNFAIESPSEGRLRKPLDGNISVTDDVADYLDAEGYTTGVGREGQRFLRCPFDHAHSEPSAPDGTSTAYLPAGNRSYEQGHWRCLHAHCQGREDTEFLDAVGYRIKDFDTLPNEPVLNDTADIPLTDKFAVVPAGRFIKRPRGGYIIKGVIPRGGLMMVYGGSGDGKTFVTLDMMLAVARGVEWNGCRVRQGRVVYVCAEDADGVSLRLNAYCQEHKIEAEKLPFGFIPATPNFRNAEDVKNVARQVKKFGPTDIIVVDTLAQVTPGADENTGKDMGLILRHCEQLHKITGALVILIHHAGKDESKGARGWSGIKAVLDALIQVSREGDSRKIWIEKLKNGRDGHGWNFNLRVIPMYEDEDGDIVDSCVVSYHGNTEAKKKREKRNPRKMGRNQSYIYDIFMELNNGGIVPHAVLRDEVMRRLPPHTKKGRDQRFNATLRAIESLIESGTLVYDEKECTLTAPL